MLNILRASQYPAKLLEPNTITLDNSYQKVCDGQTGQQKPGVARPMPLRLKTPGFSLFFFSFLQNVFLVALPVRTPPHGFSEAFQILEWHVYECFPEYFVPCPNLFRAPIYTKISSSLSNLQCSSSTMLGIELKMINRSTQKLFQNVKYFPTTPPKKSIWKLPQYVNYLPTTPAKKIYLKTTPKCHLSPDYPCKGSREIDYTFGVYGR